MISSWQQAGGLRTHTPWTWALCSQESRRKLTFQLLQKSFSFAKTFLAIKTNVMCERCWNGWKSAWARQKWEDSLMDVFWVKRIGSLSLHGWIDHRPSVSWSMPMLMGQCQWSRFELQSTMCVSRTITGISYIKQQIEFRSVYARSWIECRLLLTEKRRSDVMVARSSRVRKFIVSSLIVILHCCCRHRMRLNKPELQNVKTIQS